MKDEELASLHNALREFSFAGGPNKPMTFAQMLATALGVELKKSLLKTAPDLITDSHPEDAIEKFKDDANYKGFGNQMYIEIINTGSREWEVLAQLKMLLIHLEKARKSP